MKNKKALTILFTANAISGFAQGLTILSIPWYFDSINDYDTFKLSLVFITFGSLFWGLYSGTLVDGFSRKDVFLGTNFMGGIIILSVSSLGFKEGILPISLILLVYTTTLYGYIIHFPNLYAFAQEVTDPKDYTRVVSYIEIVAQATQMGSAALGGILLQGVNVIIPVDVLGYHDSFTIVIQKWELHQIFVMDAIAFFISFILVTLIKYKPLKKTKAIEEGSLKTRLVEGYKYLKNNKVIYWFGICSYAIFVIVLVEIYVLLVPYISTILQEGADVLGLSEMMFATGSLASGIFIRRIMAGLPIPEAIIYLTFITASAFFLVAFTSDTWVFYTFCFLIGITNAGSRIFRLSFLFTLVPNELTGRINSIFIVYTTIIRVLFMSIFLLTIFEGPNVVYLYMILGIFALLCGIALIYLYNPIMKLTKKGSEVAAH